MRASSPPLRSTLRQPNDQTNDYANHNKRFHKPLLSRDIESGRHPIVDAARARTSKRAAPSGIIRRLPPLPPVIRLGRPATISETRCEAG
jgi:hypothetical protein